jgi:hypothetical protein
MNKFEKIFGVLAVIALILKFASISGGSILATLSLTSLSFLYYLFGFALFNDIKLKNIFKRSSYKGISVLRIISSVGVGLGLSTICLGILFRIQFWPGGRMMLAVGLITILIITIIAFIDFLKSKSDYKTILLRVAIIGGIGLLLFLKTLSVNDIKIFMKVKYSKEQDILYISFSDELVYESDEEKRHYIGLFRRRSYSGH